MKKAIGFLLAVMMIVCACAAMAEAYPQPEGGKKFESDWAIGSGMVNIIYEEEGYRVAIDVADLAKASGSSYEYSCFYNEEKDALISVSSSRRDYKISDDGLDKTFAEPQYDGPDEENQETVFTIDENGCLIWKDGHDDAGAGLKFTNIGRFKGVWRNEAEEVEAQFMWNGIDPDTMFYTVYIQRGKTGADTYSLFTMNGFYNPATGKLEADGTCTVFTKNASGDYDTQDDGENFDAFFSMLDGGKILYEAGNGIELEYDPLGSVN